MSDSCVDKERIAPLAVQHYNFLKWIVLALLAALLLGMLGKSCAAAALAAPTISVPSETIEPQAVTLTGTGAPNSRVFVELGEQELGVADVNVNGDWSLTTETLSDGDYTARVAAIDPEGAPLNFAASGDWSVGSATVDTGGSNEGEGDVTAPIAGLIALGGLALSDFAAEEDGRTVGNFSWSGTGEPGATVELLANGELLDSTTVDADGNWSFDGDYNFAAGEDVDFSARMIGANGTELDSIEGASVSVPDLDMAKAEPPTLTLDNDGDVVVGDEVSFSGTAAPNAEVEILVDGDVVETVSADSDGNFTYTTSSLPAGDYIVSARAVDSDLESDALAVTVGAGVLTLTLEGSDDVVVGDEVTFSGTTAPDAEVEILVDGDVVETVSADSDGNFTYTTSSLPAGDYMVSARTVESDLESDALAVTVAAGAGAAAPVLDSIFGGNSADAPLLFSGSAEPGQEVELFIDGESVGTATADEDGNFTLSAPVEAGDRVVVVRYVEDDSVASDEESFTVSDFNGVGPTIVDASANDDGTVSVSGTAPAGSTVDITSGGEVIGTATADEDGNFSTQVALPADNDNSVGAQITNENDVAIGSNAIPVGAGDLADTGSDDDDSGSDGSGDASATGSDSDDNSDSADGNDNADGSSDDGSDDEDTADGSEDTDNTDGTGNDAGDTGDDDTVIVTDITPIADENGETPTIGTVDFGMSGTGKPGQVVIVLEDGEQVGGATVQADGTWSCTCILPPGEHVLVVQDADDPSNSSEPITFVVENLTEAPTPPQASSSGNTPAPPVVCKGDPPHGEIRGHIYIVAQCESMGLIAQRLGTTLAKLLEFNPQVASPNQIYPGQALNIPSDAGCFDNAGG